MAVVNQNYYDRNCTIDFPLDDSASATSTNGVRLPTEIIADINIRYPVELGYYPFLSAVTVTPNVIAIVIQCADDPTDVTTFSPIAAVTIAAADLIPGRQYAVSPLVAGVGGWVVFGADALLAPFQGRFADPAAGLLAPRTVRPYRPFPVGSIGQLNAAQPLSGIVNLEATLPLTATADYREIDGVNRQVIVLGLSQTVNGVPGVWEEYAGPCGARPESGNCYGGPVIQSINTVPPDDNGNITIQFHGFARIADVVTNDSDDTAGLNVNGIMLDVGLGLSSACTPKLLPDASGNLPTMTLDNCPPPVSETISEGITGPLCIDLVGGHTYNYTTTGFVSTKGDTTCRYDADGNQINGDSGCASLLATAYGRFEDPLQPYGVLLGQFSCGCSGCGNFTFMTAVRHEQDYYGTTNAVLYSSVASICVDGVDSIQFDAISDDWVGLISPTASVIETLSSPGDPHSPQIYTLPPPGHYILFNATTGSDIDINTNTTRKTWTDGVHSYTYPAGNELVGSNGGTPIWMTQGGFVVQSWSTPIPISTLRTMGLVDANNTLTFKMFHVPGGNGSPVVKSIKCNRQSDPTAILNIGTTGTISPAADGTFSLFINGVTSLASTGAYSIAITDTTTSTTQTYVISASDPSTAPAIGADGTSIVSESIGWTGTLPYNETFDISIGHFKVVTGSFMLVDDDAPNDPGAGGGGGGEILYGHGGARAMSLSTATVSGPSQRNLALWSGFDHTTVGRKYTTAIKLLAGSVDSNASLVLNCRPSGDFTGRTVYYVLQIDYYAQQFSVSYFNGSQLVATTAVAQLTNLQQGTWYQVIATVTDAGSGNVLINAQLYNLDGSTLSATLNYITNSYYPATGQVGVLADRSVAEFSYFSIATSP